MSSKSCVKGGCLPSPPFEGLASLRSDAINAFRDQGASKKRRALLLATRAICLELAETFGLRIEKFHMTKRPIDDEFERREIA